MTETVTLHGSCVAIDGRGVLILGPPGAGKSDLVLRLIDQPGYGLSGQLHQALLVADDQVVIALIGYGLVASAPVALHGKLEIRGLGIVEVGAATSVVLSLAVRLSPASGIERMPDVPAPAFSCLGVELPLVLVDPSTASAPARIRAALDVHGRP